MATANIERTVRQFIRAQFSARLRHNEDKTFDFTMTGNKARCGITNPRTVAASLEEQAKSFAEKGNTTVFTMPKSLGGGTITLKVGEVSSVTLAGVAIDFDE